MQDTASVIEPFQYVPVPIANLPVVYRLLADLAEASSAALEPVESLDLTGPDGDGQSSGWAPEDLARFAAGSTKTTELVGVIADLLVDVRSDNAQTLDELAVSTGLPRSQVKTLWTHMARHLAKHYPTSPWPITSKWGADLHPQRENVVYYFMTDRQADEWRAARRAAN